EIRQDHDKDRSESNGGKTWSDDARPDAASIWVAFEPHDNRYRRYGQQEDQAKRCSIGKPSEQRNDWEQITEFMVDTCNSKTDHHNDGQTRLQQGTVARCTVLGRTPQKARKHSRTAEGEEVPCRGIVEGQEYCQQAGHEQYIGKVRQHR